MELSAITEQLTRLEKLLDAPQRRQQLLALDKQLQQGGNWDDYSALQRLQQERKHLADSLEQLETIQQQLAHLQELAPLIEQDSSGELREEFKANVEALGQQLREALVEAEFTGPYDRNDAVLTIHVGQGGTDAQDWVEMLSRMYTKFAQRHDWQITVVDQQFGAEAGLTEITLEIHGLFAYGYLQHERGIHRLVRISPFNAGGTRETSFAAVEVIPHIDQLPIAIVINDGDLEWKTFRASGPGGQYTNKNSTAVQLLHRPSGFTVRSSTQRSLAQNRAKALDILKTKLWQQAEEERQHSQQALKGPKQNASWGQQTRNYVLHPYQLVKDLRTGHETNQVQAVLEGNLDLLH